MELRIVRGERCVVADQQHFGCSVVQHSHSFDYARLGRKTRRCNADRIGNYAPENGVLGAHAVMNRQPKGCGRQLLI